MPAFQRVVSYVWLEGETPIAEIDAEEWWPTFPGVVDNHIVLAPEYQSCREPDLELLACGHEQPPRLMWGKGRKYYNRKRRCDVCAIQAGNHGL